MSSSILGDREGGQSERRKSKAKHAQPCFCKACSSGGRSSVSGPKGPGSKATDKNVPNGDRKARPMSGSATKRPTKSGKPSEAKQKGGTTSRGKVPHNPPVLATGGLAMLEDLERDMQAMHAYVSRSQAQEEALVQEAVFGSKSPALSPQPAPRIEGQAPDPVAGQSKQLSPQRATREQPVQSVKGGGAADAADAAYGFTHSAAERVLVLMGEDTKKLKQHKRQMKEDSSERQRELLALLKRQHRKQLSSTTQQQPQPQSPQQSEAEVSKSATEASCDKNESHEDHSASASVSEITATSSAASAANDCRRLKVGPLTTHPPLPLPSSCSQQPLPLPLLLSSLSPLMHPTTRILHNPGRSPHPSRQQYQSQSRY
jgi:hypothetical protein